MVGCVLYLLHFLLCATAMRNTSSRLPKTVVLLGGGITICLITPCYVHGWFYRDSVNSLHPCGTMGNLWLRILSRTRGPAIALFISSWGSLAIFRSVLTSTIGPADEYGLTGINASYTQDMPTTAPCTDRSPSLYGNHKLPSCYGASHAVFGDWRGHTRSLKIRLLCRPQLRHSSAKRSQSWHFVVGEEDLFQRFDFPYTYPKLKPSAI